MLNYRRVLVWECLLSRRIQDTLRKQVAIDGESQQGDARAAGACEGGGPAIFEEEERTPAKQCLQSARNKLTCLLRSGLVPRYNHDVIGPIRQMKDEKDVVWALSLHVIVYIAWSDLLEVSILSPDAVFMSFS